MDRRPPLLAPGLLRSRIGRVHPRSVVLLSSRGALFNTTNALHGGKTGPDREQPRPPRSISSRSSSTTCSRAGSSSSRRRAALHAREARPLHRLDRHRMRLRRRGDRPVLLPGRRARVHRPRLLRRARRQARRARAVRAGVRHCARDGAPRAEPPRHQRARRQDAQREGGDGRVGRLELQADCFAGIWAHSTQQRNLLEAGDIQSAIGAAAAVGDDRLAADGDGHGEPGVVDARVVGGGSAGSIAATRAARSTVHTFSRDRASDGDAARRDAAPFGRALRGGARAAPLVGARLGGRAGVGRALLRLRRAPHRRGASGTPTIVASAGGLVWHPWCHYPVGYSGFLALFYRVFGATHAVAAVANALTGAALALSSPGARAPRAVDPARARSRALLVALASGPHPLRGAGDERAPRRAAHARRVLARRARPRGPRGARCSGALVLGLAALVRPQALLCAPFLALARPPRRGRARARRLRASPRRRVRRRARARSLPWTARNCRVMDGCALVQHQRRLEPRHRRVPARHRPLRDAALDRTAAARSRGRCSRTAAGSTYGARARLRAARATGSRSSRRSSGSRSTTSRSRSSTCTRRAPRWPEARRARARDAHDARASRAPRRRRARLRGLAAVRSGAAPRCKAGSSRWSSALAYSRSRARRRPSGPSRSSPRARPVAAAARSRRRGPRR